MNIIILRNIQISEWIYVSYLDKETIMINFNTWMNVDLILVYH